MPDDASIKITQKHSFAGGQELEINKQKGKLIIRSWQGSSRLETAFALGRLEPDSSIIRSTSYSYIFCTAFLSLVGLFMGVLTIMHAVSPRSQGQENPFLWPCIFFSIVAVFAYREYRKRRINVTQFTTVIGESFHIWNKLPSAAAAAAFIAELRESITEARTNVFSSQNETLANEIRGLDKLRASGVLTEEEFKNAKARLLGLPASLPDLPEDDEPPRTGPLNGPEQPGLN